MKHPVAYLHVGEPKTGTTFLQQVMWSNRAVLARQGVLLPGLSLQDHYRANQDLREVPQANDDPSGSWSGEWDVLAGQVRKVKATTVISHELLAGASAEQARRAVESLQPAQVHIVLTVRDFGTLLPAEWQETVKHRNRRTWEGWLADIIDKPRGAPGRRRRWFWRAHDTLDVLGRWSGQVPADHVHVVTVPRPGAPPGLLWERFASVIGVDPNSVDPTAARANASLGLPEVELLRHLNSALPKDLPQWFYAAHVKEALAHRVLARRDTTRRLHLPPERHAWAHDQAQHLIGGLEASGYDVVGDLDDLVPATTEGPCSSDVSPDDMLPAAIDSLAALLVGEYRGLRAPDGHDARLLGLFKGAALSSPHLKRTLRDLSTRHAAVRRLRVMAWRLGERVRVRHRGM